MKEIDLGHDVALGGFGVFFASTNYIPSSNIVLAHFVFVFSHEKKCSRISITMLRVSSVYAYTLNEVHVAFECVSISCI